MYYQTTDVTVWEEYRLFDLNAILSALGGSLGLFVGFSCLDMGRGFANYLRKIMKGAAAAAACLASGYNNNSRKEREKL